MSPLWSDMALARAAWAKAEENDPVDLATIKPQRVAKPAAVNRPVRRILYPRLSSFAL